MSKRTARGNPGSVRRGRWLQVCGPKARRLIILVNLVNSAICVLRRPACRILEQPDDADTTFRAQVEPVPGATRARESSRRTRPLAPALAPADESGRPLDPVRVNLTSSSSCQCSRLNLASITSKPGVSGPTSITSAVTALLERCDLLAVGVQYLFRRGVWRHAVPQLPLKLSQYPVSPGLPRSMYSVRVPTFASHLSCDSCPMLTMRSWRKNRRAMLGTDGVALNRRACDHHAHPGAWESINRNEVSPSQTRAGSACLE